MKKSIFYTIGTAIILSLCFFTSPVIAQTKGKSSANVPITKGTTGKKVETIQALLASDPKTYPEGLVTGYYGPLTEKAVKNLQKENGLEQVGYVGPKTKNELKELLKEHPLGHKKTKKGNIICAVGTKKIGIPPGWLKQIEDGKTKKLARIINDCDNINPDGDVIDDVQILPGTISPPTPTTPVGTGTPTTTVPNNIPPAIQVPVATTTIIVSTTTNGIPSTIIVVPTPTDPTSTSTLPVGPIIIEVPIDVILDTIDDPVPEEDTPPGPSEIELVNRDVFLVIPTGVAGTSTTVSTANINWITDGLTRGRIFYSTTLPIISSTSQVTNYDSWAINHTVTLHGLIPSTTYYYIIESANGTATTTSVQSFFVTAP